MPLIKINNNDYFDFALRKFKKACDKACILSELKKREFYIKPTYKKKIKHRLYTKRKKKYINILYRKKLF